MFFFLPTLGPVFLKFMLPSFVIQVFCNQVRRTSCSPGPIVRCSLRAQSDFIIRLQVIESGERGEHTKMRLSLQTSCYIRDREIVTTAPHVQPRQHSLRLRSSRDFGPKNNREARSIGCGRRRTSSSDRSPWHARARSARAPDCARTT